MDQKSFISRLIDNWPALRAEYVSNCSRPRSTFPIPDYTPEGTPLEEWRATALWWKARPWPVYQRWYPLTTELVREGPTHRSTGHLVLRPHSRTPCHTHSSPDWEGRVILQLPLIIPPGDVGFCVGDRVLRWQEGQPLCFDITQPHWGFNWSDQDRVLLVMDFDRELWRDALEPYYQ